MGEGLALRPGGVRAGGCRASIIPLQHEYRERVVEGALAELRAGRTPSPDIFCNQQIKFGEFWEKIDGSWDKIASGHYARVVEEDATCYLRRSPDPVKDQTYFLSALSQDQLKRSLFPIGHLTKHQVRQRAAELNLPTRDRKDSQGICFLGKINYRDFVRFHLGERPGNIVELESGTILGQHPGFWFYTIGQRHGLGLSGGPWFVVRKDTDDNAIFVSHQLEHARTHVSSFALRDLRWIAAPPDRRKLQVKVRHSPETDTCSVEHDGDGRMLVNLNEPDAGISPGQHAVLYDDQICLGGGVIEDGFSSN